MVIRNSDKYDNYLSLVHKTSDKHGKRQNKENAVKLAPSASTSTQAKNLVHRCLRYQLSLFKPGSH
jgi:hypothetical protein